MTSMDYSSSTLAFVGDAAFTLFVRTFLANTHDYKSGVLTKMCAKIVSAKNQSRVALLLESEFTADEQEIYRRCKNTYTNNIAKNASVAEYHRATGLEGVIGHLHLTGGSRLNYIMTRCVELSLKESE